jgi:hypothetical protein
MAAPDRQAQAGGGLRRGVDRKSRRALDANRTRMRWGVGHADCGRTEFATLEDRRDRGRRFRHEINLEMSLYFGLSDQIYDKRVRPLSWRTAMFGFRGGENATTVARKKIYMKEAQQRWEFLTNFDLSMIKNEEQLCSMVKIRAGIAEQQAKNEVDAWAQGKQF